MGIYREPVVTDFWQLAKNASGAYVDPWGPLDCGTHSMARAVMRQHEGSRPPGITGQWPPTGGYIRSITHNPDGSLDRSGGVNLAQMRDVGVHAYGFTLDVQQGIGWDTFLAKIRETRGAMIAVRYELISKSAYTGQVGFYGNHMMFVESVTSTTARIIDPLADGRKAGIFKGPGDYPLELIKKAAGGLNLATSGYKALGYGRVYAGFTRATGEAPIVDPSRYVHTVEITAETLNIRASWTATSADVGNLYKGNRVYTQLIKRYGGAYMYNGVQRTDWLGFTKDGKTVWIAAAWTRVIS